MIFSIAVKSGLDPFSGLSRCALSIRCFNGDA